MGLIPAAYNEWSFGRYHGNLTLPISLYNKFLLTIIDDVQTFSGQITEVTPNKRLL